MEAHVHVFTGLAGSRNASTSFWKSPLTTILDGVGQSASLSAWLRLSHPPSHAQQSVQSSLFRQKEFERVHVVKFASRENTRQDEIVAERTFGETSVCVLSELGKEFDRVFSVVIVPRHSVVIQKREHFRTASLEALLVFGRQFRINVGCRNGVEKTADLALVLLKVSAFQAVLVNCAHDVIQQRPEILSDSLQLGVQWIPKQVFVDVS